MEDLTCHHCKTKGLSTEYVFCPFCGNKLFVPGDCRNCAHINPIDAKFCQNCGISLQDSEDIDKNQSNFTILESETLPKSGITIEFGYSSSPNFDLAIHEAEMFPSYKVFGEGKKSIYRINFNQLDIELTLELVKFIRGWKSSRIFVEGKRSTWDAVYSFLWCYENRCTSFKPDLYCYGYENDYYLNIWGCTQARIPFTDHTPLAEWGKWIDNKGTWQFDKERIRHELQVALFKYRFCPAIQLDLIEDVIIAFPNTVNPINNKNWKFIESWADDGLTPVLLIKTKRFGFEETVRMKGVAPNGVGAIREIIKKMKYKFPHEIIK
ncbi:MAG TPA: zinc ribbon domain-containing protein [Brevefilum sp.]|nr:zinc ribbon domain-containing protein [Brevefilum sp.]HPL68851.1 zinc ribbon domain-containing protein [Brevefilum sp.]